MIGEDMSAANFAPLADAHGGFAERPDVLLALGDCQRVRLPQTKRIDGSS